MLALASSVPAVLISLILLVSGVAKVRDAASVRESFITLQLPPWLTGGPAPALLPWAELALSVALLAFWGPAAVAVAVTALALFVAYLVIILRAVGFDHPVECGCLGQLGLGVVGPVTVVRNALLVLLAGWALIDVFGGTSVVARWRLAESAGWAWLAAVAVALLVGALMVYAGRSETSGTAESIAEHAVNAYERTRIPFVPLTTSDGGSTTLRRLASQRARLLVFINPGCGSCIPALEAVPSIRARAPQLGIHLVFYNNDEAKNPYVTPEALGEEWFTDPQGVFVNSMDMYSPAAVLLGADGYLAGGPVQGAAAVKEFFDDIAAALAEESAPATVGESGVRED